VQAKPKANNTPQQNTVQTPKVVSKAAPASNTTNSNVNSGLKSFSLKSLAQKVQQAPVSQQKKDVKQVVEEPIDLSWNDAFNQEKLNEVWRRFARLHEAHPRFHTIVKNHQPKLVDKVNLLIQLRNKTQEHELVKERANILSYLRRNLKNAHIQISMEVAIGAESGPKKAFTVADKFKEMSTKNPALAMFKKEFNLDLE